MSKLINVGDSDYKEILRQAVAVLPWRHNLLLVNKIETVDEVGFYTNEVLPNLYYL